MGPEQLSWSCVGLAVLEVCHGSDPPLVEDFSGRGDFSLGVTWVLTPFPKTHSDESIN